MNLLGQTESENFDKKEAHSSRTAEYKVMNSVQIKETMIDLGFEFCGISHGRTKDASRKGYQKHIMTFTTDRMRIDDENHFTVLITNSYDGTTSLKMDLGIYRTVCANGLVVGSTIESERFIHSDHQIEEKFKIAAFKMISKALALVNTIKKMQSTILTSDDTFRLQFNCLKHRIDTTNILNIEVPCRRERDAANDLYTTFNRIQEGIIKGGIKVWDSGLKRKTLRKVTALKTIIDVNKKIFDEALRMVA